MKTRLGLIQGLLIVTAASTAQVWEHIPSPNVDNRSALFGISASANDNVWAIGSHTTQGWPPPIVLHWSGEEWGIVQPPVVTQFGGDPSVNAVSVGPDHSVWITGAVASVGTGSSRRAWMAQFDGSGWTNVQSPLLNPSPVYPYAPRTGDPSDMLNLGADNVWVFGQAAGFGDGLATSVNMAVHWDGSSWDEVFVPNPGNRSNRLTSATSAGPDLLYAAGYFRNNAGLFTAHIMRWDGSSWSRESLPNLPLGESFLYDIVAIAPDDIWVVGRMNNAGVGESLVLHYDGSSWTRVPGPSGDHWLSSMAAIASDNIWVLTALPDSLFHFNGVAWTEHPMAQIPGATGARRAAIFGKAGLDLWRVGHWTEGANFFTLTERLRAPGESSVGPTSMTVERGVLHSGSLASLLSSDDNRVQLRPGITFSSAEAPVRLRIEGVSPVTEPSAMRIVVESHATSGGIMQLAEAFDYNLNTWVQVDARHAAVGTDGTVEIPLTTPGRFVDAAGNMSLRLHYKATAPVFAYPWTARIDNARWIVSH
jgi:hypothetical protein